MAYKTDLPTYTRQEFLDTSDYNSMSDIVKELFLDLLNKTDDDRIQYLIKVRGDALALTPSTNKDNDIITIWTRKDYMRVLVLDFPKKNCFKKEDIDKELIVEMHRAYNKYI